MKGTRDGGGGGGDEPRVKCRETVRGECACCHDGSADKPFVRHDKSLKECRALYANLITGRRCADAEGACVEAVHGSGRADGKRVLDRNVATECRVAFRVYVPEYGSERDVRIYAAEGYITPRGKIPARGDTVAKGARIGRDATLKDAEPINNHLSVYRYIAARQ